MAQLLGNIMSDIFSRPSPAGVGMFGAPEPAGGGMFAPGNLNHALLAGGIGLMTGRNKREQLGGGLQGFLQGSQLDTERNERQRLEQERESQDAALKAVLAEDDTLSPEMGQLFSVNPTLATSYLGDRLKAKEPNYMAVGDRVFDENLGQFVDMPEGQGSPLFRGTSVDANAFEHLRTIQNPDGSRRYTDDQLSEFAAGKPITGPSGEMMFMTPGAVFPQGGAGQQPLPQGGTPGMIPLTEGKMSDTQASAAGFADRMSNSNNILTSPPVDAEGKPIEGADNIEQSGTHFWERAQSGVPWVGGYMTDDNFKTFDQAKRDFINAQLRRESGAVISPEEFDNANKQYFPMPDDPPGLIEQKALNRRIAIEAMKRSAGALYEDRAPDANGWTDLGDGITVRPLD